MHHFVVAVEAIDQRCGVSSTDHPHRDNVEVRTGIIDVSGGDKIPRKGGPGITRSDLLVINKVDLAPLVGASLEVMGRDARRQRGSRPFIFTNLKNDTGLDEVIVWLEQQIKIPAGQRHSVIDVHASYVGRSHSHDHGY